jgi:alpha-N-acetylglucosamine transferase
MKKKFVTYLGTDNYLPGVLTLDASLKEYNKKVGLLILVGESVSPSVIGFLYEKGFSFKTVKDIGNPYVSEDDNRGRRHMYTKIRVFELAEYDKIVFLDADMLVCENIEGLFENEHMSAVVAGKLMPGNSSWEDFNSGLLVICPDREGFREMLAAVDVLESGDGTDQGFLNAFYSAWKKNDKLQLNHKYNIPSHYIDDYCKLFDFEFIYNNNTLLIRNVAILHFWGTYKPWDVDITSRSLDRLTTKYQQSVALWWKYFHEALDKKGLTKQQVSCSAVSQ